jgi:hypothetical protein
MPQTYEQRLTALIQIIGPDIKALNVAKGDLNALPTAAKANLVSAIAEVYQIANAIQSGVSQATLNNAIAALRDELRAGAGAALDTFAEVAAQLLTDESAAAALAIAVNNRVRFDAAQMLNVAQQTQALANIGAIAASAIGNPDVDLAALYVAAKA